MAATDPETWGPAGVFRGDARDVAALFARLKDEVEQARVDGDGRQSRPSDEGSEAPGATVEDGVARAFARQRRRRAAEGVWAVTADRPLVRRPGLRGTLLYPVKKVLRKLMRWYVEPLAVDQRAFNGAALKLADELFEEVDVLLARVERAETELMAARERERLLAEVDERLTRVERSRRGGLAARPANVAIQPRQHAFSDYFAFESRMRGSGEEVRRRQAPYVGDFRDASPVLDVGCGRGELLGLLREAGIEARGVDADADMVAYARGEGLDVQQADLLEHLDALEDGSVGGIFAGQVVEHLPPPALVRFLELARAKLRPGGVLVAETINPLSPLALRSYFADLTHAQPLVPETLALLAREAGFRRVDTRFLNPPPEGERLGAVELPPEEGFDRARAALAANVERLNGLLYGPLDYAIVARV